MKKVPGTYTEEELLQALEEASVEELEAPILYNNVLAFLSFYGIKPGKQKVKRDSIYRLYKQWTKDAKSPMLFATEINNHLDYHHNQSNTKRSYYLININSIKIRNQIELLKLANKRDKTKNLRYIKHFDKFITENNITVGTYYIESFVLHSLYDRWNYNKTKKANPLGFKSFIRFLKLHFKIKRLSPGSSNMYYFGVDRSILNHFTEEQLVRIKEGYYAKKKRICNDKEKGTKEEGKEDKEPS